MADESKKKAYYNSLVRAGVVPSEVSYEAFNLKIRDTNFAKIVYSGLKTASDLNIVEDIPSEQQFNSVLQVGQFPTEPEISKKTNQLQPNVGSTQTNQPQQISPTPTTDVVSEEETQQQGVPARTFPSPEQLRQPVTNQPLPSVGMPPTNQPQPTAEETQIAQFDQQAGKVQGGMPQGKGLGAGQFQITDIRTQAEKPQTVPAMPIMEPIQQTTTTPIGQATPLTSPPPEQVGYFDYLGNAVQRGLNRGEIADYISATGKTPTAEEFARIAELNAENERLFTSKAMQDFSSNPDLESTIKSLPEIAIESIASLYRHGLARMGVGAVTGGVAGSVIPGAGTLAGAGYGTLSGMTVAGMGLEVSGTIMEGLNELKINTKDPEALKTAFSNPAVMDYLKQKAYARSIPIAALDAVSMGVAGKLIGKPVASAVGRGLQVLGEAGIQGGFGATGELLAQINSGEKIKPYEVLAEGLAEIPGSIPEVGIAVLSKNKSAGNNTKSESARLALKSPDMPIETINEMIDVGVGTGEINATQATELKQEVAKAKEINAKIPAEIKDTELRVTAIGLIEERENLTAQLETVDEAFKPAIQEKIKGINEQLQELTQIPQQQGTQAFFETNQPSQTNPLLRLPESVDAVMDKIDQGVLVSAESLFEVYNNVQTAIRETLANRAITPEERVATINILSGMLSDIDKANTEGQRFVEQVEEVSVQDRVPAVREGGKPLPQGQAPKGTATPSISQAKAIREENRRKQAGTTTLPSSGQTIITPAPATEATTTTEVSTEPVVSTTEPVATATEPVATGTEVSPAEVEATAKALEGAFREGGKVDEDGFAYRNEQKVLPIVETFTPKMNEEYQRIVFEQEQKTPEQFVSSAYHSAKAKPESERTSQETELINQVEQLLTPTEDAVQIKGLQNKTENVTFEDEKSKSNIIQERAQEEQRINPKAIRDFKEKDTTERNIADISNWLQSIESYDREKSINENEKLPWESIFSKESSSGVLLDDIYRRRQEVRTQVNNGKTLGSETTEIGAYTPLESQRVGQQNRELEIINQLRTQESSQQGDAKGVLSKVSREDKTKTGAMVKEIFLLSDMQNYEEASRVSRSLREMLSNATKEERNKIIEDINSELYAISKQKASIVPVQSGTTSSQEVAKGEPQAEPQSTAKQGQAETTTTQEEVGTTPTAEATATPAPINSVIGTEWDSRDGKKKITGEITNNGKKYYTISIDGKSSNALILDSELQKEIEFDKTLLEEKQANEIEIDKAESKKKEEADKYNDIKGFGDNLSPMQKAKVISILNGLESYNGVAKKRKNAIEDFVKQGWVVSTLKSGKKVLMSQDGSFLELSKTQIDYAEYLIENDVLNQTPTTEVTLNTPNETTVKDITKIENATEKGRELALAKPVNKWVKRAFDTYEDISSRAKKAGIYDGTTLKIGGKEYTVDTPAKFKAFLAQSQNNFDAINEAVNKSEIDTLKAERDALVQEFIKGMGKATMNLNPQQVSILAQLAWKNIQIIAKQSNLSSNAIASLIKRKIDEAINELNQMLTQSGQQPINPDKEDITNIINNVRKLTQGIATTSTSTAGQIGTAGQISATQSHVYTKEQEELAREKAKKMDEGKPFITRSEPFWTAVKRKVAELRQKLDSPKEMLNFVEKMIGTAPGSSYQTTRELPLGRAMEQLRGKARALALPYMERVSEALKPIEKHLPDFEKYLIYRRIIDRAQQDKLNQEGYNQGLLKDKPKRRTTGGMTETDADILLNDLANKVGPEVFNQFIDAGDNLQVIFDDNLKDLVDAGVLTQDRYNAIKAQNEFYVPFDVVQRDFRGNVITGTEYDRSTAQGQKVIQEIEGIKTPKNAADVNSGIDVFFKMMQNGDIDVDSYYYLATEHITDARNSGAITQQEYESLMDAISEPALELHSPLNKALNIINASQYQVARQGYMNDVDRLIDADTNNDYFKRLEDGDKLPSGMSVITYYKDGVQQRVAVDTKLKQAIDGMSKPELTAFEQALKIGSIPFKIAATSASVSFLPVNFVIDTVRTLTSKAGLGSGANATERVASVAQVPILYSEALVESIIGNLLNTKLGNALGLKSITPNFMYEQYDEWRKSPSYSEGTYMNYFTDKLKSGRTKTEIEDAKFLENVQRRTQTILGKPETAKAIAEAMLGAKQKTRMTADSLFDIINLIGKILENSHKIYGYTKLSGTETGVRKGLDRYIGGYIDKLNNRKKLTQTELENALDEVTDEVLNNIGSPNFEQIPPNMRAASVWLPFLGAAVKGNMTDMSRMLNAINTGASKKEQKDALAFAARNGAIFTIPAFMTGLAMALKDDDDENKKMYDEMDENSKWKNMIIPIEREVDGQAKQIDFVTIPIRGLPVIFNSIGRASGQALGMAMKERLTKDEIKRISKDLLYSSGSEMMTFNLADKTYLSNIDPETGERKETRKQEEWINRSMSALSGINPLIKYPLERVANKNFFGKYPIEPESIRGKRLRNAILNETNNPQTGKPYSPSLLKNKFTPEYAVTLSQKLERNGIRMTPMVIDHFFDTFLAGAPEKFDVGASELMKRRFLWKERKLAYGEKPKN